MATCRFSLWRIYVVYTLFLFFFSFGYPINRSYAHFGAFFELDMYTKFLMGSTIRLFFYWSANRVSKPDPTRYIMFMTHLQYS